MFASAPLSCAQMPERVPPHNRTRAYNHPVLKWYMTALFWRTSVSDSSNSLIFPSFIKCPLCYCACVCHNEHVRLSDRMSAKQRTGDAAAEVWCWGSGGGRQQVLPHCSVWGQRHRKRKHHRVRGPWQGSRSWRLSVRIAFQLSAHSGHGHTSFALTSRMRTSTRFFPPTLFFFSPPHTHSPLYLRNGFITAQKEIFQDWFVRVNGNTCDHITSGRCLSATSFNFSSKKKITLERNVSDSCVIFVLICLCRILYCSCFHWERCVTEHSGSFNI